MPRFATSLLCLLLLAASASDACRYNVRDTAFVDSGEPAYKLEVVLPASAGKDAKAFVAALRELVADWNVVVVTAADERPDASGALLLLTAPDGRQLELGEFPAEGNSAKGVLSQLRDEKLADQLRRNLITNHSVVLLVESEDDAENARLGGLVDEAIEKVMQGSALWPKAIDGPPLKVVLPADSVPAHKTLLWSLNLSGVEEVSSAPQVVVLYGRGRSLGKPLSVEQVADGRLEQLLGVVSLDCECEYDFAPLQGPSIIHSWNEQSEQLAAKHLGFDPGHPLVTSEVRYILSRRADASEQPAADPVVGYREIALPTLPSHEPENGSAPSAPAETHAPNETHAIDADPPPTSPPQNNLLITAGVASLVAMAAGLVLLLLRRRG
ncbi:hypothetical protein [Aeoliella sp.]|uniref:hypothetical protein n=1 Tax=Aeoliella sp. TaxID=2795800 RepID=UPI003CCBD8A8